MTTKDHCLFLKDKQKDFVVNDNLNAQFKNLNLNQNNQCLSDSNHPKNAESLTLLNYDCSLITSSSDYTQNKDSKTEQNSTPFGKTKLNTSFANLNAQNNYGKKEEESKQSKTLNANSSTLSLHITAYENSVEGAATSGEKDNMKEIKESRTSIKSWKAAKMDNTNNQVFELPRQQKNDTNDPEVMQFKASQKLFNSSSSVTPQPSPKVERKIKNQIDDEINGMKITGGVYMGGGAVLACPHCNHIPQRDELKYKSNTLAKLRCSFNVEKGKRCDGHTVITKNSRGKGATIKKIYGHHISCPLYHCNSVNSQNDIQNDDDAGATPRTDIADGKEKHLLGPSIRATLNEQPSQPLPHQRVDRVETVYEKTPKLQKTFATVAATPPSATGVRRQNDIQNDDDAGATPRSDTVNENEKHIGGGRSEFFKDTPLNSSSNPDLYERFLIIQNSLREQKQPVERAFHNLDELKIVLQNLDDDITWKHHVTCLAKDLEDECLLYSKMLDTYEKLINLVNAFSNLLKNSPTEQEFISSWENLYDHHNSSVDILNQKLKYLELGPIDVVNLNIKIDELEEKSGKRYPHLFERDETLTPKKLDFSTEEHEEAPHLSNESGYPSKSLEFAPEFFQYLSASDHQNLMLIIDDMNLQFNVNTNGYTFLAFDLTDLDAAISILKKAEVEYMKNLRKIQLTPVISKLRPKTGSIDTKGEDSQQKRDSTCNMPREKHLLGPSIRATLNEQPSQPLPHQRVDRVETVYEKTPKLQKTFATVAATPPSATGVRRQKCIKHELRKGYEMDLLDDLKHCNIKRDQHGLGPIPTTQQPPKSSETESNHSLQLPAGSGSSAVGNRYTPLHHNNPFQHQQQYQYPALPYQMHQSVQPQIQQPPTMFAPESNHALQVPAVSGSSAVGNRYTPLHQNDPFQHHQQQYQYPAMPYQMHQSVQPQIQQPPTMFAPESNHALQVPAVSGSSAVGNRYTPLHQNDPFQHHQQQYQYPAMPYQMHQRVQPQIQQPPTMLAIESNHALQVPAVSGSSAVGNRYTPLHQNDPFQHQQQYQYPAMPYQMHQRIQSQTQQQPSIQNNQQQQHIIQDHATPQQFYQYPTSNIPPSSRQHRPSQ